MQTETFPVKVVLDVDYNDHRHGDLVAFRHVGTAIRKLGEAYLPHVRILHLELPNASSIDDVLARDIRNLLQITVPGLHELDLCAQPPADNFYRYNMAFESHHLYSTLDDPFSRLETDQYLVRTSPSAFSLHHLLAAMTLAFPLKRLTIRNFLHIPTLDPRNVPSAYQSIFLPNLHSFTLEDLPGRLNMFLPYFYIPTTVETHIIAISGSRPLEADIIQEMLPSGCAGRIPMLQQATHVHIEAGKSLKMTGRLIGEDEDEPCLVLEARPSISNAREQGKLLDTLVRTLPHIFDPVSLTSFQCSGDVAAVSAAAWDALLAPCTSLAALSVCDQTAAGTPGAREVLALFDALSSPSTTAAPRLYAPPQLVCPRLADLTLHGARFTMGTVSRLNAFAKARNGGGGAAGKEVNLKRLRLHLWAPANAPGAAVGVAPSDLQTVVNMLATTVDQVQLENLWSSEVFSPLIDFQIGPTTTRRRGQPRRVRRG